MVSNIARNHNSGLLILSNLFILFLLYVIPKSIGSITKPLRALFSIRQIRSRQYQLSDRQTINQSDSNARHALSRQNQSVMLALVILLSFTLLCAVAHIRRFIGDKKRPSCDDLSFTALHLD
jgi:hypothetical protein